mgnify:FL=1|tara:strand:- start:180 stop:584 length:405 start_codon:yes stop_codon:yes gene_type:complete
MTSFLVKDKIYKDRISICRKCEFYFKPTGTCKKCGCFMHLKTRISYTKCPLGKWYKVKDIKIKKDIPKEIIKEVIDLWKDLKTGRATNHASKEKMIDLWNIISGAGYNPKTNCGSCVASAFDGIKKIYNKYKND